MRVWLEQMIDSLGFVTLPETADTCSWETIRWGSEYQALVLSLQFCSF